MRQQQNCNDDIDGPRLQVHARQPAVAPYDLQSCLILIAKAVALNGVPQVRGPCIGGRRDDAARTVSPKIVRTVLGQRAGRSLHGAITHIRRSPHQNPDPADAPVVEPVASGSFPGDLPSSSAFMRSPATPTMSISSSRRCRRVANLTADDEARGRIKCGSQNARVVVGAPKARGVGVGRRKSILDRGGGLVLGEGNPRATCSRSAPWFQNGL